MSTTSADDISLCLTAIDLCFAVSMGNRGTAGLGAQHSAGGVGGNEACSGSARAVHFSHPVIIFVCKAVITLPNPTHLTSTQLASSVTSKSGAVVTQLAS